MTGAPLPGGADAVVPVEDTDVWGRDQNLPAPAVVAIRQAAAVGANVRPQGQDLGRGELALAAGTRLRPQEIGFLAMLGAAQVTVWRQVRVLILSTGDELAAAGGQLQPGQIFDANGQMLAAQVRHSGGQVVDVLVVPDQPEALVAALERGAAEADLILSSAGVSVGAFDFVRQAVLAAGVLDFWRVNMRPGKPLAFGRYREVPFIGLPGNPVSAFVGFEVFVRPALRRAMGCADCERPVVRAILREAVASDGRETYLRAKLERQAGQFYARLTGHQGSGNLHALVEANSLLVLASGVKSLPVGAECDAWLLDE
jgi:molybdopterin molybdotransferase